MHAQAQLSNLILISYCSTTLFCRELVQAGKGTEDAYWELVVKDIQDACKLFEPIYDQTDGGDGYVSVEVSPRLADDTEGTVEAAKWLHKVVDRTNVYIKIPATAECVPSIKTVISLGISVNVTVSVVYTSFLVKACKFNIMEYRLLHTNHAIRDSVFLHVASPLIAF